MMKVVIDLVWNEVIDKEVDKEMTKVVEEVNKNFLSRRSSVRTETLPSLLHFM